MLTIVLLISIIFFFNYNLFLLHSKENAGKAVISRVDAWSRAHKKKNGEPVNALAAEVIVRQFQ